MESFKVEGWKEDERFAFHNLERREGGGLALCTTRQYSVGATVHGYGMMESVLALSYMLRLLPPIRIHPYSNNLQRLKQISPFDLTCVLGAPLPLPPSGENKLDGSLLQPVLQYCNQSNQTKILSSLCTFLILKRIPAGYTSSFYQNNYYTLEREKRDKINN